MVECRACPRLVTWREEVARVKVKRFREWTYWARPVPGFGDPRGRMLIIGLAPAAHGGNRTGRMFTGDASGDWLYRALHRAGFASQPTSRHAGDGLELTDCYVTAVVHCAPPDNRPLPEERDRCLGYLAAELQALDRVRLVVPLGAFAWDGTLRALRALGHKGAGPKPAFRHGTVAEVGPYRLLGSYHPSQHNTATGRLTEAALDDVFALARRLLTESD
jgi:uracil-DNA glycosylase family 4